MSAQGVADGRVGNNVTQVSQCADDAGHNRDLTADPRPTGVGAKCGAVDLLGYGAAIPGENRVRLCHAGDVFQRLAAEPLADLSERGSLWIRQAQSCTVDGRARSGSPQPSTRSAAVTADSLILLRTPADAPNGYLSSCKPFMMADSRMRRVFWP